MLLQQLSVPARLHRRGQGGSGGDGGGGHADGHAPFFTPPGPRTAASDRDTGEQRHTVTHSSQLTATQRCRRLRRKSNKEHHQARELVRHGAATHGASGGTWQECVCGQQSKQAPSPQVQLETQSQTFVAAIM